MAGRGRYNQENENVPIKEMEPMRKIFLGGLKDTTTDDTLKDYFSTFGELTDHVVIKDSQTGESRKFGFVTFKDLESAHNCLEKKKHNIDGKEVEAKRACKKEVVDQIREVKKAGDKLKIFVGGLKKETKQDTLRDLFDNHPDLRVKTESVSIAMNKETDESRGFAFVSFEDEDHVAQVATVVHFTVDDKQVDCRIADPKGQGRNRGGGRGGRDGGFGGRGGYGGYGQDRFGGGGYSDGYDYGGGGYGSYGGGYGGYSGGYGNGYGNGYGGGDFGGGYGGGSGRGGGGRGGGRGRGGGGRGGRGGGGYHPYARQ